MRPLGVLALLVLLALGVAGLAPGQAPGQGPGRALGQAAGCVAPPAGLRLTFAEEFDSLDAGPGRRWQTTLHDGARTIADNGEQQYYVDADYAGPDGRPLGHQPFRIEDGQLVITASRADARASLATHGARYLSGMLTTDTSFRQRHGYFEIRAQVPAGRGLWPAFWLLPPDGQWPPELDVMEVFGQQPGTLMVSVHSGLGGEHRGVTRQVELGDLSRGLHRYGALWREDCIAWFVDGCRVAEVPTPQDMTQPMHLLLNLAVGGHWAGYPDRETRLPAAFRVDWVRVYSLEPAP